MNLTDLIWDLSRRLRAGEHPETIRKELKALGAHDLIEGLMLTLASQYDGANKAKAEALVAHMSPIARACRFCGESFRTADSTRLWYCGEPCAKDAAAKRDRLRKRADGPRLADYRSKVPVETRRQIHAALRMIPDPERVIYALQLGPMTTAAAYTRKYAETRRK